jgi:hypothetical protein
LEGHALEAFAIPDVEVIERDGAHAHHRVATARLGLACVFVAKHFRAAVLVESNRFHRRD